MPDPDPLVTGALEQTEVTEVTVLSALNARLA